MKRLFLIFTLLTMGYLLVQAQVERCCSEFVEGDPELSIDLAEALENPEMIIVLDLSLQEPKLTKVPEEVALLINLKCLDVSYNRITSFHESFKTLENLECLDVSGNHYLQKFPAFLNEMPNLKIVRHVGSIWSAAKKKATEAEFPNITFVW